MAAGFKPYHCHDFTATRYDGRTLHMGQLDWRRNYLAHRYAYYKHDLHGEL